MGNTIVKIDLSEVILQVSIGILPHERQKRQRVQIDASAYYDFRGHALDYSELLESIRTLVSNRHFDLLEDLAREIIKTLKSFHRVTRTFVKVTKLEAFSDAKVSVTISG